MAGKLPSETASILLAATLYPFKKNHSPQVSGGVRPIAAGDTLRRLIAKCVLKAAESSFKLVVTPIQVGVAVPDAVHSVGAAISRCRGMLVDDETLGLLQVDLRNAFNAIDRKPILDFTHKYLPRAFPWVQWMLVSNVPLYCGNEVFICSTGGIL